MAYPCPNSSSLYDLPFREIVGRVSVVPSINSADGANVISVAGIDLGKYITRSMGERPRGIIMPSALTLTLILLASGAVLEARKAFAAGNSRRGGFWLAISIPILMLAIFAIWLLVKEPKLLSWLPPNGFGIDWHCQDNTPISVRVCFEH